ncbi:hypothetical protein RchiOBHm_Chr5g0000291 [Rosa chinensis]|uniref:Uncharacterized protein n=1 Tax=Rosa chinensis TaxID=74649 RepID=A0A2P6Q1Z2_ROSCH|nr:hypothetical protein RchiOBHm_Chr5g0000291 [Rosa chinensis]
MDMQVVSGRENKTNASALAHHVGPFLSSVATYRLGSLVQTSLYKLVNIDIQNRKILHCVPHHASPHYAGIFFFSFKGVGSP